MKKLLFIILFTSFLFSNSELNNFENYINKVKEYALSEQYDKVENISIRYRDNLFKQNKVENYLELLTKGDSFTRQATSVIYDWLAKVKEKKGIDNHKEREIALRLMLSAVEKNATILIDLYVNYADSIGFENIETAIDMYNSALNCKGLTDFQRIVILQKKGELNYIHGNLHKAVDIYRSIEKELVRNDIYTYKMLSEIYFDMSLYNKANEYTKKLQDAITIAMQKYKSQQTYFEKESYNELNLWQESIYINLGTIQWKLNNLNEAKEYFNQALTFNSIKNSPYIYNNFGGLYIQFLRKELEKNPIISKNLKDNKVANNYYTLARENLYKALDLNRKDRYLDADIYHNLHTLNVFFSDKQEESLKYINKSLKIMNQIDFNKKDMKFAQVYKFKGFYEKYLKQNTKAYNSAKKAFDIFKYNQSISFSLLDREDTRALNNTPLNISYYWLLLNTAYKVKNRDITNRTFHDWINYKGMLYEEEIKFKKLKAYALQSHNKNIIEKFTDLEDKKKLYANSKDRNRVEKLVKEISDLEIELKNLIFKYQDNLEIDNIDKRVISKLLSEKDSLYIDFARTDDNYYIFILDKDGQVTFDEISDETTKNIDSKISRFREEMKNIAENNATIENEDEKIIRFKFLLAGLYNDIFPETLQKSLHKYSSLVISPDGNLNFLPFDTLVFDSEKCLLLSDPDETDTCLGKKDYLIKKFKINYTSSAKEFLQVHQNSLSNKNNKNIAFLNPKFDTNATNSNQVTSRSKTLGATINKSCKKSILGLSALNTTFKSSLKRIIPSSNIYGKEYKKEASEKELLKLKNVRFLDIVTHGLYCEDKSINNPMLKTMLILEGAKNSMRKSTTGDNDGVVTALEVSTMNLKGTSLVTLLACQTGLGEINSAEGVTSINKAFIQAGAKNVISTLWSVPLTEGGDLVNEFYKNNKFIEYPSQYLRDAKLKLLKRHPYYWSGFMLYGE